MLLLRKWAQTHPIIRQRSVRVRLACWGGSRMAEHTVKVKLPKSLEVHSTVRLPKNLEVQSKDLEVVVRSYGNIIGTLKISKGSLDWRDARTRSRTCWAGRSSPGWRWTTAR